MQTASLLFKTLPQDREHRLPNAYEDSNYAYRGGRCNPLRKTVLRVLHSLKNLKQNKAEWAENYQLSSTS